MKNQSTFLSQKSIAPSLLSANFANLSSEIEAVTQGGADLLHLDIMDGHFVPNITMGPSIVKTVHKITPLPLDCHLMIENPEQYIEAFASAGAAMICVHGEAPGVTIHTFEKIKNLGLKAGIAINPETNLQSYIQFIEVSDYVLVMTVHPGFGGQKFIPEVLHKIKKAFAFRKDHKLSFAIEVDGGINEENIATLSEAGANIFVAGSAIFKSIDYTKTIKNMKRAIS